VVTDLFLRQIEDHPRAILTPPVEDTNRCYYMTPDEAVESGAQTWEFSCQSRRISIKNDTGVYTYTIIHTTSHYYSYVLYVLCMYTLYIQIYI
jgi:hypothetical protein